MSSNETKTNKGRAHAVAAWEWFKEAAWLQVLLIVGVVVGVVVAIPFAVKGITNAVNSDSSSFYKEHRIDYKKLGMYLTGEDKSCNGTIGDQKFDSDGKFDLSGEKEGFVVMFYKSNCDNCSNLQKNIESWYKNFNKDYAKGNLKFYTIDVSWDVDDDTKSVNNEGIKSLYNNKFISLEEQMAASKSFIITFESQDETHSGSESTKKSVIENFSKDFTADKDGGTMPTPTIVTYMKDKSASNYITNIDGYNADTEKKNVLQYCSPSKVICDAPKGLSFTNAANVASMMIDIYNFQEYKVSK